MNDGFKRPDDLVVGNNEAGDAEKVAGDQTGKDGTEEIVRVQTSSSESGLPFSRARTVALVATVAAAPFLSVSY